MDIQNEKYIPIATVIIIFLVIFLAYGFLYKIPAFHFSCVDGTLLGISGPIPPLACMACYEHCDGSIIVKDNEGKTICEQSGRTIGLTRTPRTVDVICPGLENYENEEVSLEYMINSTFGSYSNRMNIIVKWGKYEAEQ